jgi:hypothetical protein
VGEEEYQISEDFSDQLINQLKTSRFALRVDTADAHLNTYVHYVLENNRKGFCYCLHSHFQIASSWSLHDAVLSS